MSAVLDDKTKKVAEAGYRQWLSAARNASKDGVASAVANEFVATSKALIWRTATWAATAVLATSLEAWQIADDIDEASSSLERKLLKTKFYIVSAMSIAATAQLFGAVSGLMWTYAWAMSGPLIIITAVLGIAYLLISSAANRYKREGLRLWLYRSIWGRGAIFEWMGSTGHTKQMHALWTILNQPSVVARALTYGGERTPRRFIGHWIQIQFPATFEGKEVTLQPTLNKKAFMNGKCDTTLNTSHLYSQYINGYWVDPVQLGNLPDRPGGKSNQSDFIYTSGHQHRLWETWVETSLDSPVLEIEIGYRSNSAQLENKQDYIFRLALDAYTSKADQVEATCALASSDGRLKLQLAIPKSKAGQPK
ncbi:hypothetical protein SJI00_08880 [Pseudomonas sp. RP23018S]|uniref:hypothetical protein n=1 Tax=Pseudomonas sp. RP23018S TaxID=3096037 RepID=UPI002ACA4978|nr:hypothetical protein [Pseudomonas sp. RP23018S]MDZ5602888.1 hypothetical protein [Pseudomonas sp. RP23018S]